MKETFKNNIKALRKTKRITQTELAKNVGVSTNYIYLVETGRRKPSIEILTKIAKALDIPLSILILEVNPNSKDPMDKLLYEAFKIATR